MSSPSLALQRFHADVGGWLHSVALQGNFHACAPLPVHAIHSCWVLTESAPMAAMFEGLRKDIRLASLIPFVQQFNGRDRKIPHASVSSVLRPLGICTRGSSGGPISGVGIHGARQTRATCCYPRSSMTHTCLRVVAALTLRCTRLFGTPQARTSIVRDNVLPPMLEKARTSPCLRSTKASSSWAPPFGNDAFKQAALRDKHALSYARLLDKLSGFPNLQFAWLLLLMSRDTKYQARHARKPVRGMPITRTLALPSRTKVLHSCWHLRLCEAVVRFPLPLQPREDKVATYQRLQFSNAM